MPCTFLRYVFRMGTYPEIQGIELDGWPYFCRISSVTCSQRILQISHVSSLWSGTKNKLWIFQIFQIDVWTINLIPLFIFYFPNSSFGITKQILITKWKNRNVKKRFAWQTQRMHCKANLISLPPWIPLVPGKNHFFHFYFLTKIMS